MRKIIKLMTVVLMALIVLAACGNENNETAKDSASKTSKANTETTRNGDKVLAVTSFTLLEDMVKEIGKDRVNVHNLVPTGTDPHEYEPLPEDIKAATDADVLFYNGLNLEGGDNGWFAKMMESVSQDWNNAFELTKGVEPMYVTSGSGDKKEEEVNPHAFLDPIVGIQMTENVRDALIEIDPDNKEYYKENAEKYLDQLREIDEKYKTKINEIPEEDRVFITSEQAYQYMTKRYGLKEGYIWAIDTEENGSPEQITSLLKFIEKHDPPVLFVETNVDPRPMETVSKESGVEIYGELYSDEIGKPGEEGDTYVKYLQYNIDKIYEGLTSKK